MPERSNGQPWKGCISEMVSRVRIPFSPQQQFWPSMSRQKLMSVVEKDEKGGALLSEHAKPRAGVAEISERRRGNYL